MHCADAFCRGIEQHPRRSLFSWRHYLGDISVTAESVQPFCTTNTGFHIDEDADIARTDPQNDVASRHCHIQTRWERDTAKIKVPAVTHNAATTEEG